MTEYIVHGPSSARFLRACGMEVLVRCKDCAYFRNLALSGSICDRLSQTVGWGTRLEWVDPMDYCSQARPKD